MGGKFISLPQNNVINSWSECDNKLQSQAISATEHVWNFLHFNSFVSGKTCSHVGLQNDAICTHTFIMHATQNKTQNSPTRFEPQSTYMQPQCPLCGANV